MIFFPECAVIASNLRISLKSNYLLIVFLLVFHCSLEDTRIQGTFFNSCGVIDGSAAMGFLDELSIYSFPTARIRLIKFQFPFQSLYLL